MKLRYAPRFFTRLDEIHAHIAADSPKAAGRMVLRIRTAVRDLVRHPGLGRPGRVPDTRELVVTGTPFIVPYRVQGDVIEIIAVFHGAQRWPAELPPDVTDDP